MSVAVSPDGKTLAIDMQGSIWTLPATGGTAKRITDLFNDARQPIWSPDGKSITYFGYRDGGYDVWAIAPGRDAPAQGDLGDVRRSRAGLLARRNQDRFFFRSRKPARQQLQHLGAGSQDGRIQTVDHKSSRRLHAELVSRR